MKDSFEEREIVASFTECTGLMPALADSEEENSDITRLYAVHAAETEEEKCVDAVKNKR